MLLGEIGSHPGALAAWLAGHTAVKKRATSGRLRSLWVEHRATLLFVLLMLGFRSAWADWVTVPSGSMNPTILEGDYLLVDKHVFGLRVPFTLIALTSGRDPARGDIVVFDSPADGKSLVKRVVGVPGDVVTLVGETLVVNGYRARYSREDARRLRGMLASTVAQEPVVLREAGLAGPHEVMILPARVSRSIAGPFRVPDGMYFMMGDNRDNSADSRYFGFVPRRDIVGRAVGVIVSLNPDRHYGPRSGRFLIPLT
jgi:signal peptidase I